MYIILINIVYKMAVTRTEIINISLIRTTSAKQHISEIRNNNVQISHFKIGSKNVYAKRKANTIKTLRIDFPIPKLIFFLSSWNKFCIDHATRRMASPDFLRQENIYYCKKKDKNCRKFIQRNDYIHTELLVQLLNKHGFITSLYHTYIYNDIF